MDVFIDARFDAVYRQQPLVLVDVGARGGLKGNWLPARRHLRVFGFEPDKREFARLSGDHASSDPTTFFDVALHDRRERIRLRIARDRGLTSIFEPDREFLDTFPDAERFDTIDVQEVDADTLDNVLGAAGVSDVDFVKVDTQGSELHVLEGAARVLASMAVGVEVEVEFTPIYKGQPVFADVDAYLRRLDYQLFDLRPCYWKRAIGRAVGGPRGQIIWADALYLKTVPALRTLLTRPGVPAPRGKLLKAVSIALLYGYLDYALQMVAGAGGSLDPEERAAIERRIRAGGSRHSAFAKVPGSRRLAAALRRLSKLYVQPDAWSIGGARLGNDD
jgi:FkbM family methyltransferase